MALTLCPDTAVADWLVTSTTPPWQLITLGPSGFAAYARLRFIPDPTWPGQAETDVDIDDGHLVDIDQSARALHVLESFTATAERCYFCVWDGYSDIILPPNPPFIELPHRRYALFQGALSDIDRWCAELGDGNVAPPALAWPADRSWCFTKDVDPHWAGVGGSHAAIDALVDDAVLDVVRARPGEDPPAYR